MKTYEGYPVIIGLPSKIIIRQPITELEPKLIDHLCNIGTCSQFYGKVCMWRFTEKKYLEACKILRESGYTLSIQP